jgi:hypothetical protein
MGSASYVESWIDYRRRVRWFFGAWLGGFALAVLLISLLSLAPVEEWAFALIGALWVLAFIVSGIRLQLFPCPRCHKQYFSRWGYWPFAKICRHCGLQKWQH